MENGPHWRFDVAGHVEVPVFTVGTFGVRVDMDRQDLGMPPWAWRVRVNVEVTKMPAKGFLLVQVDLLIKENST
jgi:hypothetical protein